MSGEFAKWVRQTRADRIIGVVLIVGGSALVVLLGVLYWLLWHIPVWASIRLGLLAFLTVVLCSCNPYYRRIFRGVGV